MNTMQWRERALKWLWLVAACALLAACASSRRLPAPVEDRSGGRPGAVAVLPASPGAALPGAENAGKPGYYTVRPGDTLIRIALETGQNWRDIARWNNLDNPNVIEVGQVLRVVAPVTGAVASAVPAASAPPASAASAAQAPSSAATASAAPASAASPAASAGTDDQVAWTWPTNGNDPVIAGFDEAKNKGVDIGGRAGDPVFAAADGRVVYAGAGLRGYGNLIILKHNNTYLTAYAHNQSLLVKEDQTVRKGQKIAEMGSTDADRVKLHFEIRRQGKPVDPTRYLPPR
ncbi:MAG: peptidoglycan DD-metalloendopeptidase family protein [Burkholderiales bacterium]|nr:peptidoglycan DD-metalloendopeptidase family protein [Burkholderiales bacterium]